MPTFVPQPTPAPQEDPNLKPPTPIGDPVQVSPETKRIMIIMPDGMPLPERDPKTKPSSPDQEPAYPDSHYEDLTLPERKPEAKSERAKSPALAHNHHLNSENFYFLLLDFPAKDPEFDALANKVNMHLKGTPSSEELSPSEMVDYATAIAIQTFPHNSPATQHYGEEPCLLVGKYVLCQLNNYHMPRSEIERIAEYISENRFPENSASAKLLTEVQTKQALTSELFDHKVRAVLSSLNDNPGNEGKKRF